MAVNIKKKNKPVSESKRSAGQSASRSQAELRTDDLRSKAMKYFHPSVVDWFKKNFQLDLNTVSISDLYKLGRGELTSPLKLIVTPTAFSRDEKKRVAMDPIQVYASLRASIPFKNNRPVPLEDGKNLFVDFVPCRPYAELASPGESVSPAYAPRSEAQREAKFNESQLMALEGIGLSRERLFGGFNHLSLQEKLDILDNEIFPVDGFVRTESGMFVNVCGEARLINNENGTSKCVFEPFSGEKMAEGLVLDLERGRIIGNLELELYERTSKGDFKTDVNGDRILNAAGKQLLEFGVALEPVDGKMHKLVRDKKGAYRDSTETKKYFVKVANGNLYPRVMSEKEEMVDGVSVAVPVFSSAQVKMKDDKIFALGQSKPLEFLTPEDKESMLQGKGGFLRDVVYKDNKTGKSTVYDAFAFIGESGYAEPMTPYMTEKVKESRKAAAAVRTTTRRKQRFGQGL